MEEEGVVGGGWGRGGGGGRFGRGGVGSGEREIILLIRLYAVYLVRRENSLRY